MSSGCGDVLSLTDLQTAKKHQLFEAEVITGKAGGVASGADIDYATNQVTGQTQKTLPAVLRDAGLFPASFDFTTGGTLGATDRNKVVYDPVSKTWYSWGGALPHVIAAGTNPVGIADWKPQTDPNLRNELAAVSGASLIGVSPVGTLDDVLNDVTPEQFGAVGDGVADDTAALKAMFASINDMPLSFTDTSAELNPHLDVPARRVVLTKLYRYTETLFIPPGVQLFQPGFSYFRRNVQQGLFFDPPSGEENMAV